MESRDIFELIRFLLVVLVFGGAWIGGFLWSIDDEELFENRRER